MITIMEVYFFLIFWKCFRNKYSDFDGEGILINIIGLLFISFGGLSVYLVTQPRYRRLPMPEDEILLSSGSG